MRDDALDAAPAGGAFNELLEPADLARKHLLLREMIGFVAEATDGDVGGRRRVGDDPVITAGARRRGRQTPLIGRA
ncbi:hypothetical protein X736_29985 [Mesorhizobium sp. L2C089B000]|nr:hypothetical protein X736_29985 [Mesorhizobium sp. L2C089B000]